MGLSTHCESLSSSPIGSSNICSLHSNLDEKRVTLPNVLLNNQFYTTSVFGGRLFFLSCKALVPTHPPLVHSYSFVFFSDCLFKPLSHLLAQDWFQAVAFSFSLLLWMSSLMLLTPTFSWVSSTSLPRS